MRSGPQDFTGVKVLAARTELRKLVWRRYVGLGDATSDGDEVDKDSEYSPYDIEHPQ